MATHQRENSHVVRLAAYRCGVRERRSAGKSFSWGISACWCCLMRCFHRIMGGQKGKVEDGGEMKIQETISELRQPVTIKLTVHSRVRKWAAENAYTLVVMALGFGITWAYLIIQGVRHAGGF
jgi:hypothetical protein